MALDLSFQNRKPRILLPDEQQISTPLSQIEGARTLFDITKNIYEERIRPAIDSFLEFRETSRQKVKESLLAPPILSKEGLERLSKTPLLEGPRERFGAVKESIEQKSFAPLAESFQKQAERFSQEMSTLEGQTNLVLSFAPGGMTKVSKAKITPLKKTELPQLPEAPVPPGSDKLSRENLTLPKDTTIPEELQPLAQEARKYKSAEEFVSNQRLLFRGDTTTQVRLNRAGEIDLSANRSVAEEFARKTPKGVVNELYLDPKAKVLDVTKFDDVTRKDILEYANLDSRKTIAESDIIDFAKDNKFDAVDFSNESRKGLGYMAEVKVLNKDVLKTKSQLTDFYNQAIKGAEKLKERRFYQSIEKSPNTTTELKQAIKELPPEVKQYDVVTDKSSLTRAQEFIRTQGEDTALSSVLRAEEMSKDLSVMGQELMRRYQQTGRTNLAVDIAHHLATKATSGGQLVQSFSILNKLSPEGILLFASRRIGQKLSPQFSEKITAQAKKIEEMPYGYEKFKETQKMIETIAKETPKSLAEKGYDWLLELANLPRAVMSSFFDFSFGLRQGIVTLYSHPKEFGKAFKAQFKPFASEGAYDDLMDTVMKHPDFELAQKYGVGFTDINLKLGAREERYMSSFAEKIPVLGIPIRATNRAYTAMANKLRIDTFSSMVKNAERTGMNIQGDGKFLRDTAKIVNDFTGRGEFGSGVIGKALESAKELLNAFFFSPRLAASRINLLYPGTYVKLNPQTRKEALRGMLAMASGTTTILYLASLIPGVEVGVDPRSADFGKIKHGNTRIDIMGGFQQYIRMGSQFISGKYVSSSTGKVITLGEGYNPLTRTDILLKGVESKEAPIFSFAAALMRGQDFEGNKINVPKEIGQRFVPMLVSDVYELYKEDPELLPLGLIGMFGVGLQSYAPPEAYIKLNEINNSPNPATAYDQLKIENPLLATKVKKAKKEENFTEFDWMLTGMKVNNGDRARFLIERFNSLKTKEEKAELYDDLREKKIISDTVAEQIKNLLEAQQ